MHKITGIIKTICKLSAKYKLSNSITMSLITKDFISYFKDLNKNNNRDWFHTNKKRYEESVKKPFANVIAEVAKKMKIEIEPKNAVFRINRDIRFSKDKTPYKVQTTAIISKYGRKAKDYPGYYLRFAPGSISIGGGAYFLEKDDLYAVRQHIQNNPKAFAKLLKKKAFVEKFGELQGEKNKRIPKEFVEAHAEQPLIANKQFFFMAEMSAKEMLRDDLVAFICEYFRAGTAINEFLIEGLGK